MEEILTPKALVVPRCTDITAILNSDVATLVYCNANNKLGFVTAKGISGELITSAVFIE